MRLTFTNVGTAFTRIVQPLVKQLPEGVTIGQPSADLDEETGDITALAIDHPAITQVDADRLNYIMVTVDDATFDALIAGNLTVEELRAAIDAALA